MNGFDTVSSAAQASAGSTVIGASSVISASGQKPALSPKRPVQILSELVEGLVPSLSKDERVND
jgi:hypothetical protein